MKKFLAMVMTVAMVISMMTVVSFAVDSVSISMGPVYSYNVTDGIGDEELTVINAGDTIAIPVTLSDRNGLKAASFKITWDPALLSMSNAYNEDDDIYAAYPITPKPALFNQVFSINVNDVATGSVMVAGSRKSAFSSAGANFSLGYLVFTVLDKAAGKDVELTFVENGTKTCFNDGTGDKAFTSAPAYKFSVAGGAPAYTNGYYDLKTNADNTASVSYFGTVGAATLYVATYKAVGTGYELAGVATKDIAAGTVDALTTVTTDAVKGGDVIKAFLWDAALNTVTLNALPE